MAITTNNSTRVNACRLLGPDLPRHEQTIIAPSRNEKGRNRNETKAQQNSWCPHANKEPGAHHEVRSAGGGVDNPIINIEQLRFAKAKQRSIYRRPPRNPDKNHHLDLALQPPLMTFSAPYQTAINTLTETLSGKADTALSSIRNAACLRRQYPRDAPRE